MEIEIRPFFNLRLRVFLVAAVVISNCTANVQNDEVMPGEAQSNEIWASVGAFFESRTLLIPHDEKIHRGGEDSAHTCDTLIVVADGVGGWERHGVNPGLYSKALTKATLDLHLKDENKSPRQLIVEANAIALANTGSATIVALKIKDENTLEASWIGDSGYSLFHIVASSDQENGFWRLEQYYRSKEGQRSFNFPYQIGTSGDDARSTGTDMSHEFQDGDIVIVYSDGVSDNLYDEHFLPCLEHQLKEQNEPVLLSNSQAAYCIARNAYFKGKSPNFASPFAKHAQEYGKQFRGGKHDDITITVAQIYKASQHPEGPHRGFKSQEGSQVELFSDQVTVFQSSPEQGDKREQVLAKIKSWDEL